MGLVDRLRAALAADEWDGRTGPPRSSNGASSLHLRFAPGPDGWEHTGSPIVEVSATLEVVVAPSVPALYFWALQASMAGPGGAGPTGGAHLGLQWYPAHPGSTAVNWGGYRSGGGELDGTASVLPSATGNVNTRDYAWSAGRPQRLMIRRLGGGGAWSGSVTDLATGTLTEVRTLHCAGDRLVAPMVWSEVFADCDAPPVTVRWSSLTCRRLDDTVQDVTAVRTSYQAVGDGGCAATDSRLAADGAGFEQCTATERTTRPGAWLVQSQSSRS